MSNEIHKGRNDFDPGYFAFVMATGIVSISAHLMNIVWISWGLFWINLIAYAILLFQTVVRLFSCDSRLIGDVISYQRGARPFALVAGTCVLGSQFVMMAHSQLIGVSLLLFGLLLWIIIMYVFFVAMSLTEVKPALREAVQGTWLVVVVSTQSIAVLGALLAPECPNWKHALASLSVFFFLLGCMLYMLIIEIIVFRLLLIAIEPGEFSPSYWINMGGAAITALAGSTLLLVETRWPFLKDVRPFLQGLILVFWITATWWIPLLAILEIWRYVYKRFPVVYNYQQWNMVFPLGMYSVSSWQLAKASELPFLTLISEIFFYIAILVYSVVFVGLIHRLYKKFFELL